MAERVALIDYGAGNLQSVRNALKAAGIEMPYPHRVIEVKGGSLG